MAITTDISPTELHCFDPTPHNSHKEVTNWNLDFAFYVLANFVYTDSDLCKMYMLLLLFEKQNMFRYINYIDVYPQKEKKCCFDILNQSWVSFHYNAIKSELIPNASSAFCRKLF